MRPLAGAALAAVFIAGVLTGWVLAALSALLTAPYQPATGRPERPLAERVD